MWHGFCLSVWPHRASDRVTLPSTLLSGFLEESTALLPGSPLTFLPGQEFMGGNSLEWWPSGIHQGPAHGFQLRTK